MISHRQVYFPPDEIAVILADIGRVLESGRLTLGPETAALEAEFARCAGTRHAVAVASGTAALEIVLRALGVRGREVIVPANTFYATAGPFCTQAPCRSSATSRRTR